MRLIALVGPKRSGKSEVAKVLKWHGFTCVKFAQPLKDMILSLPGMTKNHVESDLKDEPCDIFNGKTVRHAMQTLGTEWGRDCIDKNIWLSLWKAKIEGLQLVVTDDCRFVNEAQVIKDLGGEVWEVQRGDLSCEGHSSETEMQNIKAHKIVLNNGNLYDLTLTVQSMLGSVKWEGEDIEPPTREPSRVVEGSDA